MGEGEGWKGDTPIGYTMESKALKDCVSDVDQFEN